jgi:phage shock protein C
MHRFEGLHRNREQGVLTGVCQGLGEYFDISPWLIRLVFIVVTLPWVLNVASTVAAVAVYIALSFIIPSGRKDPPGDGSSHNTVDADYTVIDEDDPTDGKAV